MEIHIRLAGVQLGPYTQQQVRDYMTEGLLSATDQAKVVGRDEWISVAEVLTMPGGEAQAEDAPEPVATPEQEPPAEAAPEPVFEEEAPEPPEGPKRAPEPAAGVTHLPTRAKESGRVSLPSVVEALSKKTIMIGPTAPHVPSSSSGRTGYSVATTTPLTQTGQATKKLSRSAMVKALSQQTSPLPTKSVTGGGKVPLPPRAPTPSRPAAPPMPDAPPKPAADEGITVGRGQPDDKKPPRQSLLKSLTAKTVPMRTSAAPPLPASATIPVTEPLPTRSIAKPPSGKTAPPPPSVVNDLTKKLGQMVQPDPIRSTPPAKAGDEPQVETVKITLNKVKAPDKSAASVTPAEEEKEKPKPPARKRSLTPVIAACAALAILFVYYVWSPYRAAASLRQALSDGDPEQLADTIDFSALRASLKDQAQAQIGQSANAATALDMMDKSIDLFVTPDGISGLVSKSNKFTDEKLAETISFGTALKIFFALDNEPVQSQGLSSIGDFALVKDSAVLHLKFSGLSWKLKQVTLRPDLLAPASPDGASPLVSPVIATYLERGDAKMKKSDWPGAIAAYTGAIAIDPRSSIALNARGTARQSKGDLDGATKDYSQALQIDPKMAAAYEGRGNVKAVKNDLDGAIADYTQAVHFDPTLAAAYDARGNAKTAKDDLEGAIADYTQATSIDPTLASAYSDRGFARQANGNLDGAIDDYTKALALKPKTAVAYYNRGLARQSQGNTEAAIVDYDRALAFDPKLAGAFYNRGNAKNATHDLDGAIADYTSAIALNPKIALAYCNRGVVRQAKGDLEGAIADYTEALEIDPKIAIAYYNRGRIKQLKNDPDGAIADSTQALDLDPKNAQAYFNRGFAKLTKNNLEGGYDDLKLFCDLAPRDHNADHARLYLWLIAKSDNSRGDADQGLSDALENNWNAGPDDSVSKAAAFLLGRISEADYFSAVTSADSKKDQGPLCEAWYFAGMKRLLMGDKATAIDYFHKCVATGQADYCEYILAKSELKTLEASPAAGIQPPSPPPAKPPSVMSPPPAAPATSPSGTTSEIRNPLAP